MVLLTLLLAHAVAFEVFTTPEGAPLAWEEMPVAYTFSPAHSPQDVRPDDQWDALDSAFGAWSEVAGADIAFSREGGASNTVGWKREWPWDEDMLAITGTWSSDEAELLGFEIHLNGTLDGWSVDGDGRDLQNVLAHEVGHVLGLDHNPDERDATMFPSTFVGEIGKRDLHADDEAGARFLYASGDGYRDSDDEALPPALVCATSPSGGTPALLTLLAAAAVRRRARRT